MPNVKIVLPKNTIGINANMKEWPIEMENLI